MNINLSDVSSTESETLTSRDRHFFSQLNRFMTEESARVGANPSKERYAIFRLAFEKVNYFYLLFIKRIEREKKSHFRFLFYEDN